MLVAELMPVAIVATATLGMILCYFSRTLAVLLDFLLAPCLILMVFPAMIRLHFFKSFSFLRWGHGNLTSIVFNFVVIPLLLLLITKIFVLPMKDVSIGFVLVGLFPSTTFFLIWVDFAEGNRNLATQYLLWNALLQIILVPLWIYVLLGTSVFVDYRVMFNMVLWYVFVPFVVAWAVTQFFVKRKGYQWFANQLIPRLDKMQVIALLGAVLSIFGYRGSLILEFPDIIWMITPATMFYFAILLAILMAFIRWRQITADVSIPLIFSAMTRNFTVAFLVASVMFADFPLAKAITLLVPLIEIPLMLILSLLFRALKPYLFKADFKLHPV
jgi:ACR3 family arsenite transporter